MNRRAFLGSLAVLAAPSAAGAQQQAGKMPRVGVLVGAAAPQPFAEAFRRGLQGLGYQDGLKEAAVAARALGVQLQVVEARGPAEFDRAFSDMTRARAGALMVLPSPMFFSERRRLVDLAAKHRLPTVFPYREFVDVGGLMAYGPNLADLSRRAATYVDKILKGARPGDLPVEQATKFDLVINLRTAKALARTIPPSVLQRADQVIE